MKRTLDQKIQFATAIMIADRAWHSGKSAREEAAYLAGKSEYPQVAIPQEMGSTLMAYACPENERAVAAAERILAGIAGRIMHIDGSRLYNADSILMEFV